jgi:DNA invertase Pin-like site-specific DNA recombinase
LLGQLDQVLQGPANILATCAEFEVDLLRMHTRQGMAIAKTTGKLKGKQPKLSARHQAHLVEMHAAGKHAVVELAELFNVSPTVYRVPERHQACGKPRKNLDG